MTSSIWPYDTFIEQAPPIKTGTIGAITCFVASPFEPQKRWNDLFELILSVCKQIESSLNIPIECYRADQIASSGIIHPEIWKALRTSDIIICDVTGQNGNVTLELGVAAAWRRKENVIILRDISDEKPRLFDINPARHIEYDVSLSGSPKLRQDLLTVITNVIATVPFQIQGPFSQPVSLPFHASLTDGKDHAELYTQDITHRRMLSDCLEFGAPLVYRHSWMSLSDLSLSKARVKAQMKMTLDTTFSDRFMGIMLRGQSYYANFGHFVLVRADGQAYLVVRDDTGQSHDEPLLRISEFNMRDFAQFDIAIDDNAIRGEINGTSFTRRLQDLPYVFSAGKIFFIAGHCRVGIRNIEVDKL